MSSTVDLVLPKEEEPFGLGCALEYFAEHEEIFNTLDNLKNIVDSENTVERTYEKYSFILNQYIEQPHLIDSHITPLLEKFIDIIRDTENSMKLKHLAFKFMFVVVNVRGYKVIMRNLPHEVSDFEPVLQLLESQAPDDVETWTTRYILLLWLSIIVMIPFHMSRFDGFMKDGSDQPTVMERILNIIKVYAVVPDKCRDSAAYLCHRFITRSDVKEKHLSSFIDWAKELSLSNGNVFVKQGALACIATILKHGKREDLLPYATDLLQWVVSAEFKNFPGANVQKLAYKIIQRIGLTFLPPRIASWRYRRGNRSLAANLSSGDSHQKVPKVPACSKDSDEIESEEVIEVPEEVEEVIDQLILALRSYDKVVRWSAAKGIGRVTGRLPKDLADDVVGSILELFNPRETDGAWHGGCLALAELSRRGLLLPDRLPQVVPVVLKALVYDEPKGYSSVGSHIRDAACYVCWSFSRAYEGNVLTPHVKDIAGALLIVTCFDKEINCRRAAAAAFQENVGRQGTFPHGIDILTTADFFSVSVRSTAFLNISVYIAQFEEYTLPLIDHLVSRKVDYWDSTIRELTAKALHNLTSRAPDYMVSSVLPTLLEKTCSIDLNARHGSVLAIGEIVLALSAAKDIAPLNEDLLEKIRLLISKFREKFYFKGLGGELMRQACCDFIQKCSLAHLPYHDDPVVDDWLLLLNECISYEVAHVRAVAITALPALLQEYYISKLEKCDDITKKYVTDLLNTSSEQSRMGYCLALGALPKPILERNLDLIITSLIKSIEITPSTLKWAESRRDAVKALTSVALTMADSIGKEFATSKVNEIYNTFLEGLKDYTVDKRGDVGAWVREASVLGIQNVTFFLSKVHPQILTAGLMGELLTRIAQQAVEKIDRTRAHAAQIFYSFIHTEPKISNIPHHKELMKIFPKDECDVLNWKSSSVTFPKFVQLAKLPAFTYNIMVGLICSIGGLTETLVKDSSSSFFSMLKTEASPSFIQELSDVILKIFMDYQKIDRITVPMFRFLDKLFDSGCLDSVITVDNSDFMKKLFKLIQLEISGCRDIYKLIDGINVFCQFIHLKGEISDTALIQLSILLCHRQSYVRRTTSSKLYEALLVHEEDSKLTPETLESVMMVLSSTDWEKPVDEIRPVRNEFCRLMGIRTPVIAKKT
ncbi:unnamed protein product [Phyllotreta striolata]|uniref:Tubulin-specific chaperone D n=1 Tax=Phyllotreta striolata TaxID=444603 RepID=A0A9N9TQE3_PHYSR|nr:unnamed protein product [Phyllotreta striolata]